MRWYCVIFTLIHVLSYGLQYGKTQETEVQVDLVFEKSIEGIGTGIAWYPSGAYFVAGIDSTLYFFNPTESEPFREITLPSQVSRAAIAGLAWSPDGTRLAILWGGDWSELPYQVFILDVATGETALILDTEAITTIHWSPNGQLLAGIQGDWSDFGRGPEISNFMIWDSQTGELLSQYRPEEYAPSNSDDINDNPAALAWMTDSQLITLSYEANLAVIDLQNNKISMLEGQPVERGVGAVGSPGNGLDNNTAMQAIDWQASGNLLAFGATFFKPINEEEINIWDIGQGQLAAKLLGHTGIVTSVDWHPTEDLLASGSLDKTLRIWDTVVYREIANLPHDDIVTSLAWNPQGDLLASVSENGTVYLWNVSLQN